MKIKRGTILNVNHFRKGNFEAIAIKDFDTEEDEFYPVSSTEGEEIACRKSLCEIEIIKLERRQK